MAKWEEIIETHKEVLDETVGTSYSTLKEKLEGLGYEVLINNKEAQEFIPSKRLSEVVTQREQFRNDLELANAKLDEAIKANPTLKKELDLVKDENNKLLSRLESQEKQTEVIAKISDAHNAKDVLVFVNFENIKKDSKGNILGVDAEVERIRTEKPYLFKQAAGTDKGGNDRKETEKKINMNDWLRSQR